MIAMLDRYFFTAEAAKGLGASRRLSLLSVLFSLLSVVSLPAQPIPILPTPQVLEVSQGSLAAENLMIEAGPGLESELFIEQLHEAILSKYGEPEKDRKTLSLHIGLPAADARFRRHAQRKGLWPESRWGEEGYSLLIEPGGITLAAGTSTGLFYGVQSLRQLMRAYPATAALPCMKIVDWPALPVRGIMDDISRGPLPNMDFMKAQIRRFAELKYNLMTFYIEHVIKTAKHGGFAPADGITIAEFQELSDYAADYHIELMGSFQSLGHFRNILAFPQYAPLGLTDRMLKPADPAAIQFLTEVYEEMYPAFTSEVFAINCDEAWDLGRGKNKALADSIGVGAIYASHVNPLIQDVLAHGKRPIMWGDIALSHPDALDLIPKETLIGTWDYSAFESFAEFIDPIVEKGFDFWVCPGVLNSYSVMPDFNESLVNIRNFVNEGYEKGTQGMLLTVWDDGGLHFFSRDWYGVAYGAEQSWHPNRTLPTTEFDQRFDRAVYGAETGSLAAFLHQMNRLAALAPTQEMNNEVLWQQLIPARGEALVLDLDGWEEVKEVVQSADSLWQLFQPAVYATDTTYWQFTLDQLKQVIDTREQLLEMANAYGSACLSQVSDRKTAHKQVVAIQQEAARQRVAWQSLQDRMEVLWRKENRAYWQDYARVPYVDRCQDLSDLEQYLEAAGRQLEAGNYLPAPTEVRLAISPVSGKYFSYWLIAGPFSIDKPHVDQPDFLVNMGGEAAVRPIPGEFFATEDGRTLMWDKFQSPFFDRIDFTKVYEKNTEAVAYAYCRIISPKAQQVRATFGSNDGITVFCNGERVFQKLAKRSLVPDEDQTLLSLKAGTNHVLLKIEQWKASWGFSFRLPDNTVRNHKYKYEIID